MFGEDEYEQVNIYANVAIDYINAVYTTLHSYNMSNDDEDRIEFDDSTLKQYERNSHSNNIEDYSVSYITEKYDEIISAANYISDIGNSVLTEGKLDEGTRTVLTNNLSTMARAIIKIKRNKSNIKKFSEYAIARIKERDLKKALEAKKIAQAKIDADKIKQAEADAKKLTEVDSDINKKAKAVTEQVIRSEVKAIDKKIEVTNTILKDAKKSTTNKQTDVVITNLEQNIKDYIAQKEKVKTIPQKIKGIVAKIVRTFRKLININSDGASNIKGVVISTAIIAAGYSIIYGIMKSMKGITLKPFYNVKDAISNIIRVILSPSSYGYIKSILVMIISALTLTGITGLVDTVVRMLKGKFKK